MLLFSSLLVGVFALAAHICPAICWKLPADPGPWGGPADPPTGNTADSGLPAGCQPSGYSHRYPEPWILPEYVGLESGWDPSDIRHVNPADMGKAAGFPPGYNVSLIYEHGNGAQIWLGSQLRGEEDLGIHQCLGITAIMDMTVPEYWWFAGKSWLGDKGYPFYHDRTGHVSYGQTFPTQHRCSFPHEFWWYYFSRAELWLDEQMQNGRNVMIYDNEGCTGAAALSIGYTNLKSGSGNWTDTYDALLVERPCVEDINEHPEWISNLDYIVGSTYTNEWRSGQYLLR